MAYPNGMPLSRATAGAGTAPIVHVHAKHLIRGTALHLSRATAGGRQPCRRGSVTLRAEKGGDRFIAGFVFGGVVGGLLGWVFAPQISSLLLDENDKLKVQGIMEPEEEKPAPTTEQIKEELQSTMTNLRSQIDNAMEQVKDNPKTTTPGYDGVAANN